MPEKMDYHDEPIGELEIIPDFLPSPADLALKEEVVKITIALSKDSVDYFKDEAARHHTKYQRIIRQLLDLYVARQRALSDV